MSSNVRVLLLSAVLLVTGGVVTSARAGQRTGTVVGHVALVGDEPGNVVIRMGVDPKCAELNEGTLVAQESALVSRDNDIANVFVQLEGTFPAVPVPDDPVVVDQTNCFYRPRVVGARVGQMLQIRNDDGLLHNIHAYSTTTNGFNVGQPIQGMVHRVTLEAEDGGMLRLGCDLHRWMTAYVGVVPHPYFAVSDRAGVFTIGDVPPGTYTARAWHETFGETTGTVTVEAGGMASIDFRYAAETGRRRRR